MSTFDAEYADLFPNEDSTVASEGRVRYRRRRESAARLSGEKRSRLCSKVAVPWNAKRADSTSPNAMQVGQYSGATHIGNRPTTTAHRKEVNHTVLKLKLFIASAVIAASAFAPAVAQAGWKW